MQEHGEFARDRDHGALLGIRAAAGGDRGAVPPQIAQRSERPQDLVRGADEQAALEGIARFGNA